MSLKAKIRNTARANGIPAQLVLQQYLNERFLVRLSMTNYRDKFVVKGGTLIASIVGLSNRATMDMDTTLKDLPLTPDAIENAINTICSVDTWDGITFKCERLEPIRDDDLYGGYRVLLQADYGKIAAPMSMDVSTGDIITPGAIQREFSTMFDSESFHLWSYNVETILAEKVETILSRNVFSTRPRDFYDLYVLTKTEAFDRSIFQEALNATARHRKSLDKIKNIDELLLLISKSSEQQKLWNKYCEQFSYAQGIEYTEIIRMLTELLADVKVG
jgi:predicted nucleotidyltransferase component of viral defense system